MQPISWSANYYATATAIRVSRNSILLLAASTHTCPQFTYYSTTGTTVIKRAGWSTLLSAAEAAYSLNNNITSSAPAGWWCTIFRYGNRPRRCNRPNGS